MKIRGSDIIRWALTVALLVCMWRGNKICLYLAVTCLSVANEAAGIAFRIIAAKFKTGDRK